MRKRLRPDSLLRASTYVLIGNAAGAIMGFAVLAILARSLEPASFGVLAALTTIIDIGIVVIDAILFAGVVIVASRYAISDPVRSDMALKLGLLIRLPLVIGTALVGILAAGPVSQGLTGSPEWAAEVRVVFLVLPLLALQGYIISTMQARQAFGRLAVTTLYKNFFRLGAVSALLLVGALSVTSAVWAFLVAAALALGFSLVGAPRSYLARPGFGDGVLGEIFQVNKWMAIAALGLLGARVDIVMLSRLAPFAETGYYAAALQLCLMVSLVSSALVTTLLPRTAQLATDDEMRRHFRRCLPFLPLGLLGLLPVLAVSGWAVPLALGANFGAAVTPFNLLMASAILTLVTNPILLLVFPMNLVPAYAMMTLVQLVLRVAANWYVMPTHGAAGAAAVDLGVKLLTIGIAIVVLWMMLRRRNGPAGSVQPVGGQG